MLFKNIKKFKDLYENNELIMKKCIIFRLNFQIIITFKD